MASHAKGIWKVGGKLEDVLIIGAGSGTDTAVALIHGAQSIDAVEILTKESLRWEWRITLTNPIMTEG